MNSNRYVHLRLDRRIVFLGSSELIVIGGYRTIRISQPAIKEFSEAILRKLDGSTSLHDIIAYSTEPEATSNFLCLLSNAGALDYTSSTKAFKVNPILKFLLRMSNDVSSVFFNKLNVGHGKNLTNIFFKSNILCTKNNLIIDKKAFGQNCEYFGGEFLRHLLFEIFHLRAIHYHNIFYV